MRKTTISLKKLCSLIAILAIVYSCSNDNESNTDVTLTSSELTTILETDDVSGVADTVLSELYMNNNTAGKSANDNECYSAVYTDTGYTVTFNNCVLNGTENVNGTLTVTYDLENDTASYTASYVDFYVGEIKLNGTREYELSANSDDSSIFFTVTSAMELVMENDETVSENGTKTLEITFGDNLATSVFSISGTWTLNIDGDTYIVNVTTALEGNFACSYLNAGIMNVSKNGLVITVNFGDGTCDDVATLTYPNGATQEISL